MAAPHQPHWEPTEGNERDGSRTLVRLLPVDKAPNRLRIVRSALYVAGAAGTLIAATGGVAIFLARALMTAERDAVRRVRGGAVPNRLDPETVSAARLGVEVAAYRTGYADGFVDCVTVRSSMAEPKA